MSTTARRCSVCRGEVRLTTLDPMAGEEAGVRLRIEGMPALVCAEGHRRFLAPDFAVKLMEALFAQDPLVPVPSASQKGLLRKRLHCASCGGELPARAEEHVEVKRVLELKGSTAFGVRVELPKLRCGACGKDCVPPERTIGEALMKASVQAFQSAAVRPT